MVIAYFTYDLVLPQCVTTILLCILYADFLLTSPNLYSDQCTHTRIFDQEPVLAWHNAIEGCCIKKRWTISESIYCVNVFLLTNILIKLP